MYVARSFTKVSSPRRGRPRARTPAGQSPPAGVGHHGAGEPLRGLELPLGRLGPGGGAGVGVTAGAVSMAGAGAGGPEGGSGGAGSVRAGGRAPAGAVARGGGDTGGSDGTAGAAAAAGGSGRFLRTMTAGFTGGSLRGGITASPSSPRISAVMRVWVKREGGGAGRRAPSPLTPLTPPLPPLTRHTAPGPENLERNRLALAASRLLPSHPAGVSRPAGAALHGRVI
jgi:hypothetical protein